MVHVDLSLIDLIAEPLVLLRDSQILACSAGALRILEGTPRAVEDLPPTLQRELRGRLADGSELWGIGPETNEGHLRRLLWEHPDAMLEVSPLGAVSWMNGAATQILGAGLENLLRAVAPGGQPAFTEALRRARAGAGLDATCPFEAQGESLPLRVSFVPHRRPGQILVWLHTSAPAARPQPVEGPLTASLAHDLNNALTVVTSALGEPGQSLGADSELLRLARVALQRAGQLASDLLFLARGPSAGPTEPCLLGEALDEASARLRAAGGGSLRIVGATPALPLWVEADATLVLRLIGLLKAAMPDSSEEDIFWGYHFVTGALTLSLARTGRIDHLSGGLCRSDDFEAIKERMAAFMAFGFIGICKSRAAERLGAAPPG